VSISVRYSSPRGELLDPHGVSNFTGSTDELRLSQPTLATDAFRDTISSTRLPYDTPARPSKGVKVLHFFCNFNVAKLAPSGLRREAICCTKPRSAASWQPPHMTTRLTPEMSLEQTKIPIIKRPPSTNLSASAYDTLALRLLRHEDGDKNVDNQDEIATSAIFRGSPETSRGMLAANPWSLGLKPWISTHVQYSNLVQEKPPTTQ
jgi:hypothetical protein